LRLYSQGTADIEHLERIMDVALKGDMPE